MSPPSEHSLIRALFRPLQEQAQRDVKLAMQVALLKAHDYKPAEIAKLLPHATTADLKAAEQRLKLVADQIDRDSDL